MKKKQKPIVNWDNYSKSTIAVAMNQPVHGFKGHWYEFQYVPVENTNSYGYVIGMGIWQVTGIKDGYFIPRKFAPKFNGNWKDSLVLRPKNV